MNADDLLAYYWLKEELVSFCRQQQLPATGSKAALTARIAAHLWGEEAPPAPAMKRAALEPMPARLTLQTRIGAGWRCSQALRNFFEQEIGSSFHFNQALRDYITHVGIGHSLAEATAVWRAAKVAGPQPIAPQFEYNQFTRTHYEAHPHASAAQVREAWRRHRNQRRDAPAK